MILAAGRGERMRPLTDTTPKPLLQVGGKPLIVWHIERLVAAGLTDLVINHAHLGQKIVDTLGTGEEFGASISYSAEPPGALETAGGIANALSLLDNAPFLVVNGDVWCNWDFRLATGIAQKMQQNNELAHLILVQNPAHHTRGDFSLKKGLLQFAASDVNEHVYTYSGIGVYAPELFEGVPSQTPVKLRPLLDKGIAKQRIAGALHTGRWVDVGTPERLQALDQEIRES